MIKIEVKFQGRQKHEREKGKKGGFRENEQKGNMFNLK